MPTQASTHYEPREQFMPFHNREERWAGLVCHRRAGKTVACINEAVHRALYTPKTNARFAYIAPYYRQAKDVAWVYLKEATKEFAIEQRASELRIILPNDAWITLYGADNPDALRGLYLDGVILDEFGDCRPTLWAEVILPTLMDRKGWAVFIGTPKGKNHFFKIIQKARAAKNWYTMTLKGSKSGILDQESLDEMRDQMTEDQYMQEVECSFEAAVLGTYYADTIRLLEERQQIKTVPYDNQFPVYMACDLGFTDSTAMWFWQYRPDGIAIIDFEQDDSKPLQHYFDMLLSKPYKYGELWLPHDARAKTLQTGKSTVEQFIDWAKTYAPEAKIGVVPKLAVQHGIDAGRLVLPHCHIDIHNCEDGIEALRAYRRKYDDINKCFSPDPLHDWASHGADGFRYLALVAKDKLPKSAKMRPLTQTVVERLKPVEIQLMPLWEERDGRLRARRRSGRI